MVKQVANVAGGSKLKKSDLIGTALRPGMWVVCDKRIGILSGLSGRGIYEIMLVDDEGLNVMQVSAVESDLRQARASEIPPKRIEHLSADQLATMGYAE